jgi:type I restriction enzyme S subunit
LAQRAIADFLDTETARIDALIAKKRKQSALIDLRWIALVTDLVRGRHIASANHRVSGVDWIEELPEEWGTPSVGMMFDVQLGKMLNQRAAEGENQRSYLRNQNVQWDSFDLKDVATMHFEPDEHGRFTVRKGDLLVCEGGDVGRAAMWSSEAEVHYQKALHRVRPRTSAPSRFLMYVLWAASSLGVFAIEGNQSTIVHLTREQLRAHRVPWPPEEQQCQIVAELDKARAKMRDIKERLAQQIELLAEHRQALITAAVTGQLDVPGVADS